MQRGRDVVHCSEYIMLFKCVTVICACVGFQVVISMMPEISSIGSLNRYGSYLRLSPKITKRRSLLSKISNVVDSSNMKLSLDTFHMVFASLIDEKNATIASSAKHRTGTPRPGFQKWNNSNLEEAAEPN